MSEDGVHNTLGEFEAYEDPEELEMIQLEKLKGILGELKAKGLTIEDLRVALEQGLLTQDAVGKLKAESKQKVDEVLEDKKRSERLETLKSFLVPALSREAIHELLKEGKMDSKGQFKDGRTRVQFYTETRGLKESPFSTKDIKIMAGDADSKIRIHRTMTPARRNIDALKVLLTNDGKLLTVDEITSVLWFDRDAFFEKDKTIVAKESAENNKPKRPPFRGFLYGYQDELQA